MNLLKLDVYSALQKAYFNDCFSSFWNSYVMCKSIVFYFSHKMIKLLNWEIYIRNNASLFYPSLEWKIWCQFSNIYL